MINVSVDNGSAEAIERAKILLAGVPKGFERAIHSTMPRVQSHLRKESRTEIRKEYAVSAASLSKHDAGAQTRYHLSGGDFSAEVEFRGTKLALIEFQGSGPRTDNVWDRTHKNPVYAKGQWRMLWPGKAAAGHQLKGTGASRFTNAFIGKVGKGGHIGIFENRGTMTAEGSDAIRQLMGDASPQMLDRDEVKESLSATTAEVFERRLDHEVSRILNGWGGK